MKALSIIIKARSVNQVFSTFLSNCNSICNSRRFLSSQNITANIRLYTEKPRQIVKDTKTLRLRQESNGKSLALILPWFQALPKHLVKYCTLYTEHGFDVLVVNVNATQLIRPLNGTQVVAGDVLKFLVNNENYEKITIHGFCVGGYVWGECLVQLYENYTNHQAIVDRIKAQVWDSVSGAIEVPIGVATTYSRTNLTVRNALIYILQRYLDCNYDVATKHYLKSQDFFHHKSVKAPALLFCSKTDQIGTEALSRKIIQDMTAQGIKSTLKVFESSPHVQHYREHKEEYLKLLLAHLQSCSLLDKGNRSRTIIEG